MSIAELIRRVEGASEGSRELDCRIWCAVGLAHVSFDEAVRIVPNLGIWIAPAYTTSLDAAMTLVPEGATVSMSLGRVAIVGVHLLGDTPMDEPIDFEATNQAALAACALTASALRARALASKPAEGEGL